MSQLSNRKTAGRSTPSFRDILPEEIVESSVVLPLLMSFTNLIRYFERTTGFSQTRLLILLLLRDGISFNQNQIATAIGADRTVIHRSIKTMIREGLVKESRKEGSKSIGLSLTDVGEKERRRATLQRRNFDKRIADVLTNDDYGRLTKLLFKIECLTNL